MPEAFEGHLLVVVPVAEERPQQLEGSRPRDELPHGQRVRLLLHDEIWPQRLHDDGRIAWKLAHRVEQARIVQAQVLAQVADVGGIGGRALLTPAGDQSTRAGRVSSMCTGEG